MPTTRAFEATDQADLARRSGSGRSRSPGIEPTVAALEAPVAAKVSAADLEPGKRLAREFGATNSTAVPPGQFQHVNVAPLLWHPALAVCRSPSAALPCGNESAVASLPPATRLTEPGKSRGVDGGRVRTLLDGAASLTAMAGSMRTCISTNSAPPDSHPAQNGPISTARERHRRAHLGDRAPAVAAVPHPHCHPDRHVGRHHRGPQSGVIGEEPGVPQHGAYPHGHRPQDRHADEHGQHHLKEVLNEVVPARFAELVSPEIVTVVITTTSPVGPGTAPKPADTPSERARRG